MTTEIVDLDASSESPSSGPSPATSLDYSYPPNSCDSIRLLEGDLDTLEADQYVNDNIINFYLRHLLETQKLGDAVHVFNSFFYMSLAGTGKTVNYERVQSWTRRVDIFAKESLLVPIIQSAHWRLAVVGLPRLMFEPEEGRKPYLVCFDSYIQGYDSVVARTVQEYLKREWEARNGPCALVQPLLDLQVKHPMQTNESDCGLFVLEFAERYLCERAQFHLAASSGDAVNRSDWFQPKEANVKRQFLKWLIRCLADGRDITEVMQTREVYFLVPTAVLRSRRRKRPRLPLDEEFQFEQ